ncbi:MAG: hypothetical protein ACRC7N_05810 [Clostridium sp.]
MSEVELQEMCINKILKESIELLNGRNFKNKLSYILLKEDERIISEMNIVSSLYGIVDSALSVGNYKKAFRFSCIMRNRVCRLKRILV